MQTFPVALVAALASIGLGQLFKAAYPIFQGRGFQWKELTRSGGMPSAHTAAAVSMALVIGLREGFGSSVFAVSTVFAAIVAHDAVKVRGTINTLIEIVRESADEVMKEKHNLPETVGHNALEVVVGLLFAGVVATLCHVLLP